MDIVIGAGVTGLTYARFSNAPCLVVESDNHTGGLCNTIYQDGFVWDYSGHFFHFRNTELAAFFADRIDSNDLVEVVKHAQIRYKDRLVDFPFQKNIHQLEYDEFLDCLCDLFDCNTGEPASFKSMLYSRFGKSIAEKFLIPYNEKLYAADLDRLDVNAMGRFFPYADREEIIRNFRKRDQSYYNSTFIYPRQGAIQYVKAIERDIPKSAISLNERVLSIDIKAHKLKTDIRELEYGHLISTVPFVNLLDLCNLEYDKSAISWNKVLVFNLGFDKPSDDRANHWIYFPEREYVFYRVGFYSNIIPSDRMSLYIEIGLKPETTVDVSAMLNKVLEDLKAASIVSDQQLISWHHVIMNPAYVHVTTSGMQEVKRQKEILSARDVYSIGRYGSWNYSSIEDNMLEALSLAGKLTQK